jgi:pseudaminic acid synthase
VTDNVKAGDLVTDQNVRSVRPGFGMHPKHYSEVLGTSFNKDVEKGSRLSWDQLN